MNAKDLVSLLVNVEDDVCVVLDTEKGTKEASSISLFVNVRGEVVLIIE